MVVKVPDPEKKEGFDLAAIRKRLEADERQQPWRSFEQLVGSEEFKEFLEQEFPRQASVAGALSRRDFLKLLAAPLAMAGLSACVSQPSERIMPYVEAPEAIVPGRPLFFATAMELNGYARGLLVESREGRPIKVEGNPQHPASLGATDAFAQASILGLYDPDRAQVITSSGSIRTWDSFLLIITQALDSLNAREGAGLHLLTGTISSPTLASQINALLELLPQAQWHQYDPVGRDNVREGAVLAFGEPVETRYNFEQANVILSLDNNFIFSSEPGSLNYIRQFTNRRRGLGNQAEMNRLYMVESTLSTAGGFADHRLPLQAAQVEAFTRALAAALDLEVASPAELPFVPQGWIEAVVADLQANRGTSLILAGPQQPPAVHALAHAINQSLGNIGQTVIFTDPIEANPVNQSESLHELAQALEAGQVDLLVVFDGNPVYSAPADLNFPELYRRARLSVYLGLYEDETAALSHWHIPATHYLEMWSDTRAFDGTVTIVQPLIEPLYGGRSPHELLAVLMGQTQASGYDILRQYWQEQTGLVQPEAVATGTPTSGSEVEPGTQTQTPGIPAEGSEATPGPGGETGETPQAETTITGGAGAPVDQAAINFERFWEQSLYTGMVPDSALPEREVSLRNEFISNLPAADLNQPDPDGLEIVFEPDPSVWDGRFANNAWLQELPRPVTKLTWDNAAMISPGTAERLGLKNEDMVELNYTGRSLRMPVWILPGQPDNSVAVQLGYGRRRGGRVFEGTGFNTYQLRTSDAPWFSYGLEIRPAGQRYPLATTQNHHNIEGRDLVRVGDIQQFQADPELFKHMEHHEGDLPSIYPEWEYPDHAWGMAINLSTCIGCNACVIACQAENNIPVVGKEQVMNSREMHWLRVDSYYSGHIENPEVYFQPLPCMHCEKAPCEPVCPVAATVHSSEGLNEMIYNRCVGTRYCSNNCPYKVRRFNFYQYVDENTIPLKLLHNPEVTVRSRGVMEKCTYCVQRISAARIQAKSEGRPIQDGEVITACQQACPSQAIIFGDINDETSLVRLHKEQPQNYGLLSEIGTQPRTTYLGKLRNRNPDLPVRA